jgi:hypothetical protein
MIVYISNFNFSSINSNPGLVLHDVNLNSLILAEIIPLYKSSILLISCCCSSFNESIVNKISFFLSSFVSSSHKYSNSLI